MEESNALITIPNKRPPLEQWEEYARHWKEERLALKKYQQFVENMKNGPQHTCYFVRMAEEPQQCWILDARDNLIRAFIMDGLKPKPCDIVTVNAEGVITGTASVDMGVGNVMTMERTLSKDTIMVSIDGHNHVCIVSEEIAKAIKSGKLKPGDKVIGRTSPPLVYGLLPPSQGHERYQFLLNDPVPDVNVDRDIGSPHTCIGDILWFFRMAMTKPEMFLRYNLRKLALKLFYGPPGGGKTLALKAIHRQMYDLISEVTGLCEKDIGKRVFKLRCSQVLSMWLGESDKNWDRFFDEIVELARTEVDGRKLPVLVIIEEVDALARQREGNSHDPVERIMTTALQRLDPINDDLNGGIISINATTNEPNILDRAFLRRIGGTMERFGMLDVESFPKVLIKHIARLPISSNNGYHQTDLQTQVVTQMAELFFHTQQPHVVEVQLGNRQTLKKYRRDFLTGALIDRSVQQTAAQAARLEMDGKGSGINIEMLAKSFVQQIDSVLDQLTDRNAHKYLELPDGEQVASVKRVKTT